MLAAKFDGTRTIAYVDVEKRRFKFLNRRGIFFEYRYPEMEGLWEDVDARKIVLDGELVIFEKGKPNFYLLEEREHVGSKTRIELLSKLHPATLVVFDVLHVDGKDLVDLPLERRKEILESRVSDSKRLVKCEYVLEKGVAFFDSVKRMGLEGAMAKKLDSPYEMGKRSRNWLKLKVFKTMDVVICGFTEGEGSREGYFGALLCGVWDRGKLRYVGRVGTGFDERTLERLRKMLDELRVESNPFDVFREEPRVVERVTWVKPKLVAEVKFMHLSEDLKMRAPSFVKLRADKSPDECVLDEEIKEI